MTHARVWDLPGWESPLTVKALAARPGSGYFALSYNNGTIVTDHDGQLYVKEDTALQPHIGTVSKDWAVQAVHTAQGVALYIPKPAYANVGIAAYSSPIGYRKVAKILESPNTGIKAKVAPSGFNPPTPTGWSVVPLKKNGVQIGTVKVAWGDGKVSLEFMDSYGAGQRISGKTFSSSAGFSLAISPTGTSVTLLP